MSIVNQRETLVVHRGWVGGLGAEECGKSLRAVADANAPAAHKDLALIKQF